MIAGAFGFQPSAIRQLTSSLSRVGPGTQGIDADATLAYHPLLASAAVDDRIVLLADSMLDYAADLAAELGLFAAGGHPTDAQLLLAAYRRWGTDALSRIEGDFAVAIWDREARRLSLARDVIGTRPLYFRAHGTSIAFASLPLPIAAVGEQPSADLQQVASYLSGLPEEGSRSFVAGVERVIPGHFAVWEARSGATQQRWWRPSLDVLDVSFPEAMKMARDELTRATAGILAHSDGVIGADLSGGLDSSLTVTTAAEVLDDRGRLIAFTGSAAGPVDVAEGEFVDEAERAAETASMAGVRHVANEVAPASPLESLDRWFPLTQSPIANACNLSWLDANFSAARDAGAGLYLTGAHGNFTLSRSGRGRLALLARAGRFASFAREAAAFHRATGAGRRGLLSIGLDQFVPSFVRWTMDAARSGNAASDALMRRHSIHLKEARAVGTAPSYLLEESPEARLLGIQSVDEGSSYLSVRSRHGLTLRDPTATRRMIELCLVLPAEAFFDNGESRRLARALLDGRAPDRVSRETRRGLQGANWRAGFEMARPAIAAEIGRIAEDPQLFDLLDVERMERQLSRWPTENWSDAGQIEMYRNTLFRPVGAARFARFVREWTPEG